MSLTPPQRVALITAITRRLSTEHWPFIDLTLKAFGLPRNDNWSGSSDAYVLEMIGDADAKTLVELGLHVGFKLDAPALAAEPPFWETGLFRLFVGHPAAHREFAAELKEELRKFGISAFVAHNDIEPTLEWQAQIVTAPTACDALVAHLHPSDRPPGARPLSVRAARSRAAIHAMGDYRGARCGVSAASIAGRSIRSLHPSMSRASSASAAFPL